MLASEVARKAGNSVVIGRLGTAYANNGFEEVVEAFQLLLDRRANAAGGPEYRLRFAGNVFETYRPAFDRLIAPLGRHVEVTGAYDVADLPRLYGEIDVSLLLQGVESFANVTPTR